MSKKDYSLALKFTAKTSEITRAMNGLYYDTQGRLREMNGRFASMGRKAAFEGRKVNSVFAASNNQVIRGVGKIVSGFGGVTSAVTRIGGLVGGVFVGGLKMAFGMVGRIAKGLRGLPMAGLKLLAVGGAAVFAAHKALSPAAEMERYGVQLDVLKKSHLYNFLTKASAGKPFQMGETVQAGVLMEAFKINSRKFLSTVMDAAAGFKKPLEEIVRMLGYARSGRTGEALESSARIGITRNDLKKFGIQFEKSGAATAETADKLMSAMLRLMQSRFGGMASRIGTGTYEGAVSDLKDSLFRTFAKAGQKFLPYGTKIVRSVSGTITSIGDKLSTLPWDQWGEKLAGGVKTVGRIVNNLMDSKRRADITKSIMDGWNAVKSDIPNLGKAIVLDLVDVATSASAPKISKVFSSAIESGGKVLGGLMADPLINIWNVIHLGLVELTRVIVHALTDFGIWIDKVAYSLNLSSYKSREELEKAANKRREQREINLAKLLLGGLVKTNAEEALEKWQKDMAKYGKTDGTMPRTKAVMAKMRVNSSADEILEKLTAPKEFKPITLSLLYPGRDSGYINGKPVPLSTEQLRGNALMEQLARMLPDMFTVKKETDVFGRELKQFSIDLKGDSRENLDYQKQILVELRKLNSTLGG